MLSHKSAVDQWRDLKATLQAKLEEGYEHLDAASKTATQTFEDRLAKVHGPLAELLRKCRQSALLNVRLVQAQRQFCSAQLAQVDGAVRDTSERLHAAADSANLAGFGADAEIAIVAPLLAGTSKIVVEALCLCWLLSALLGHKEADAFVHGAKDELWGAIWDPGTGVLTLLKRLYAVASRTLRKDQDAAELLESLAEFEALMEKWRTVAVEMGNGQRFDQALSQVFTRYGDA